MKDIVIIGAGGFGRETVDVIGAINGGRASQWRILGVVDDAPSQQNLARTQALGLNYLGGLEALPRNISVALSIGHPTTRQRIASGLMDKGIEFPSLIHPSTSIGSSFTHGRGVIVLAGVSIGTNVHVGNHLHLNAHAVLGHDVKAGHAVSVNPNATISGECHIGSASLIGASSTVLQGLNIGSNVTVGAGACVVQDVPDGQVVVGVPALPLQKGQTV